MPAEGSLTVANTSMTEPDPSIQEAWNDPRSVHELISFVLCEQDEDVGWEAISLLQRRGSRAVFEAARDLCRSECPIEKELGALILGQNCVRVRTFTAAAVTILITLLETETDEDVLRASCISLGHMRDPAAVPALIRMSTHSSDRVRLAVAFAVLHFSDESAIETLIALSTDPDGVVRDWALFGLGCLEVDTPEIRNALFLGTSDVDEVARGEALRGLAQLKDLRVFEPLLRELSENSAGEWHGYSIEAAEELADPRLLPVLLRLKAKRDIGDERYDAAIRLCSATEST